MRPIDVSESRMDQRQLDVEVAAAVLAARQTGCQSSLHPNLIECLSESSGLSGGPSIRPAGQKSGPSGLGPQTSRLFDNFVHLLKLPSVHFCWQQSSSQPGKLVTNQSGFFQSKVKWGPSFLNTLLLNMIIYELFCSSSSIAIGSFLLVSGRPNLVARMEELRGAWAAHKYSK